MKKIISTPQAPKALGPYNQAIVEPKLGLVFTSGQIGLDPQTNQMAGSDIKTQTHQVFANLKAVLEASGCGFDKVIKSTIFLKDMNDFSAVNEIYAGHFVTDFPARSTVEVARLPKDALVEIEMIASV
jgi:2-iminobutanoate/2-iminopropanoate deaminase